VFDLQGKRVWVAGHRGMVGSAIVRRLAKEDCQVLTSPRQRVDLRNQAQTQAWMQEESPEVVVVAAAKVGGILANSSYPVDFLYDNLMIEANVLHAAHEIGVQKLLFLGSSCIYPRMAPQPMSEDALLTGPLEPTNEWYAIAKIAGIKLCQAFRRQYNDDFISAMPTNLYGPGDNYDLKSSHVLPALIRKAHQAKLDGTPTLEVWGTGSPLREFLHVDDLADACVSLLKNYSDDEHVNVGSNSEITIRDLAVAVAEAVGFKGEFVYDASKPDGTPRKLMNSKKLAGMGWTARIGLHEGLANAYAAFLEHESSTANLTA